MLVKPVKQFLAWSYSRLHTYQQCPLRAKLAFLDKVKEPESPALLNGSAVHKLAERFCLPKDHPQKLNVLPQELKNFKKEFMELRKLNPQVEQQWAFTRDWKPTGWFDKDCWVRVVVDACFTHEVTLTVIDHKTGGVNKTLEDLAEHKEQLSLYALCGMLRFPEVETVSVRLWYLDRGDQVTDTFTRKDIPALKKHWAKASSKMMADTMFAPRPGDYCRWCYYSQAKLKLCKF